MDKKSIVAAARFAARRAEVTRKMNMTDMWEAGDLVQLDPERVGNPMLAGCIMVVTELRSWGVIGYVQAFGRDGRPGGQAHYRAKFDECSWVGKAKWLVGPDERDRAGYETKEEADA